MSRPRKHSDDDLVTAAARAIASRGPQELTLAHVAEEAGVAPATLVQRFGSKRGLLLAVAASGSGLVASAFSEAQARHRSPLKALEAALVGLVSGVNNPDEVANHLSFLALDLADPEFRAHTAAHCEALRAEIEALVARAIAEGEVAPTSRRRLADAVHAAYHGTLFLWAIDRSGKPEARLRGHLRLALGVAR